MGASLGKMAMTVIVQATLARLLGPADFGLFALGMLIMGVAGYFADLGLATGLIARPRVEEGDVRFVFTANLVISLMVATVVALVAGPLALFFEKPDAEGILRGLAPVFILNAVASVSVSLLRRELDYRTIQLAGLAGYGLGFGLVGIGAAYFFGSVYALVGAYFAQSLITLVLLYRKARHPIGLTLVAQDRAEFVGFGVNVLVTNLVNWAVGALDRLLVGRLFNAASLGQYTAAYNLVYAPVGTLYPNIQSTVFSAMARMEQDTGRIGGAYLELLQAAALLIPPFVGIHFLAPSLVATVYGGARWHEAMQIAAPLCLMAPFIAVWACSTPVLWNTGRRSHEWKVQLPFVAVAVVVIVQAAQVSIVAVAWSTSGLFIARTLLIVALACRALGVDVMRLSRALLPACWLTPVVGSATAGCVGLLSAAQPSDAVLLAAGLATVVSTMVCSLLLVPKALPPTLRRLIGQRVGSAPPWLRPMLARLGEVE